MTVLRKDEIRGEGEQVGFDRIRGDDRSGIGKCLVVLFDEAQVVELGVDGVVISNHGARQLEDTATPAQKITEFCAQVDRPILVDSGFRRGADVVKAVALGARAVLLGRATLYGLASQGEEGVSDVLRILRQEIDTTLALIGCARIADLSPAFIQNTTSGKAVS
jgi:(S)-mandelate dehydrogenase